MDFLIGFILFPFHLIIWLLTNWELVLLFMIGVFVYLAVNPILASNKAKAAQKREQEENRRKKETKASEIIHLNKTGHEKYAETNKPFSLKTFLSTHDFDLPYKSGIDLFVELSRSDLVSESDKEILKTIASQGSADYLKSTNANALLKADSRELQLLGNEILMRNYFFGNGGLQDYEKVYEIASKISHFSRDAQYYLGEMYLNGFFVDKNYNTAKDYLIAAGIQGDAEAFISLHKIYSEGLNVVINNPFAFACLNIAYHLKPKKEEWRDLRDNFSEKCNKEEINLGQKFSKRIVESNYRDLPTLVNSFS